MLILNSFTHWTTFNIQKVINKLIEMDNNRLLHVWIILCFIFSVVGCDIDNKKELPTSITDYISSIEYDQLGIVKPVVIYSRESDHIVKVVVSFELSDSIIQDDWKLSITPAFTPDFHWAPHLTPTDEHIIAQHVFRSPAVITSSKERIITVIPDLDLLKLENPVDWYMDVNALDNTISLGLSASDVKEHVLFVRKQGAVYPPGKLDFGFYILVSDIEKDIFNPFQQATSFLWEKWGEKYFHLNASDYGDLEKYVEHTYNWAFNTWKKSVWQEFDLNGKSVGAPVFIVNTTQSPNNPGEINEREFRSVWNQAWFNSLRSASGLYRYARRTDNQKLMKYALKTKELALSFPQDNGFFPGLIATEMGTVTIDGKQYNRSKGWHTSYFGNSNRNPYTRDARVSPYHILDMSFTANQMLLWYSELEKDQRLLDYSISYAEALINIQFENGFYPAWLNKESLTPMEHLNKSPESAMSVTFLLNLYSITGIEKYRQSALKAMDAISANIISQGRWEDFETYWSCSRYGSEDLLGKKIERNNQYKQNTLSMFWTAEALLKCYNLTNEPKYINLGERTLDELLMYQSIWQPPYIYIRSFGGFGVMNADGEWNDARQSLFSELIILYGKTLEKTEYVQRGLSALLASFEMMYCPENSSTKEQWEKVWPFFAVEDYGFMMENYGHSGITSPDGIGIGKFTIYDWGNGAASEAYNRILDHWGEEIFSNSVR